MVEEIISTKMMMKMMKNLNQNYDQNDEKFQPK